MSLRALHGNVHWQARPTRASLHPRIFLEIIQPSPRAPPEHSTEFCARALAARLTEFWHQRGFPSAQFWAVEGKGLVKLDEDDALASRFRRWDIRSNLINGIPPEVESRG